MNTKLVFIALILPVIATLLYFIPNTTTYSATEPLATLYPELIPVCSCESTGYKDRVPQQFNEDGSVIFGKLNKLDTGMCQINQKYHIVQAHKMGMDIFTEQGNIRYANYLYEKNGLKDWEWSKHCWK